LNFRFICFLFFSSLFFSCSENKSVASDTFFELDGQHWKSKKVSHFAGDIYYRATEVPVDYYLLKNLGSVGRDSLSLISNKYNEERIVEFEFEHIDSKDLLEREYTNFSYDKSVMYLASSIRKDFKAVTSSGDTLEASGVHFERHFKVSPFKRVLLYFGGIAADESIQLVYQDQLFNNGVFKFKFDELPLKL